MLIREASPAPKFVSVPADVLTAALQLSKGHLETLMRLGRFLWSGKITLEGTSADFCETIGVQLRSWQRHVPELGRSGCLRYSQPQHGYYVVHGYPDDVSLLCDCWSVINERASAQSIKRIKIPGLVDALFLSMKTTKLSLPVVVPSLHLSPSKKLENQKEQQHGIFSPGGSGGGEDATKLSFPKTTELSLVQADSVRVLTAAGISRFTADRLAQQYDPSRVDLVVRMARQQNGGPGWIRRALEEGWTLEVEGTTAPKPRDYLSGEYAHLIRH